jgi:FkbM family methyltransferase
MAPLAARALSLISRNGLTPLRHVSKFILDSDYRERERIRRSAPHIPVETTLFGRPFTAPDGRAFLVQYRDIVERQVYRFSTQTNNPLIIDAGANAGVSVLYFKWLYPNCRVIAFEPDRKIFEMLKSNVRRAGLSGVELINKAVWSNDGFLPFYSEGRDAGRLVVTGDRPTYSVQTVSLRKYLTQSVALLKLDIEGAEVAVIDDVTDLLKCVETLFIEYHSFRDQPQLLSRILTALESHGFRVYLEPGCWLDQPFVSRRVDRGMDIQLNVFAFRASGTDANHVAVSPHG